MTWQSGKQYTDDLDNRWPQEDDEEGGEEKENQREQQLNRKLCRHFFGPLIPLCPHGVRMDPQGLSHTGSEFVRLNQ